MVKKNGIYKVKTWIYIVIGIMTIGGIFASVVLAWGSLGGKIDSQNTKLDNQIATHREQLGRNASKTNDLEIDGCKPAQKHTTEIAVIKTQLEQIRDEQKAGFKSILERLPIPK